MQAGTMGESDNFCFWISTLSYFHSSDTICYSMGELTYCQAHPSFLSKIIDYIPQQPFHYAIPTTKTCIFVPPLSLSHSL